MSQDLFDVEVDFTWAHDSEVQNLNLTFQNIPQGTCWQVVQTWRPLPPP